MHFDASAIIHAWDNYPISNFPPFWNWIEVEIQHDNFAICEIAFDEVKNKMFSVACLARTEFEQ